MCMVLQYGGICMLDMHGMGYIYLVYYIVQVATEHIMDITVTGVESYSLCKYVCVCVCVCVCDRERVCV